MINTVMEITIRKNVTLTMEIVVQNLLILIIAATIVTALIPTIIQML